MANLTLRTVKGEPLTHSELDGNFTELNTELAGKAASSHTHAIADVTGLQTALDGKAVSNHTHTLSQISDFPTAVSATELGYLDGVTGAIQNQLNGKLSTTGKAADSDKLDGLDSTAFVLASSKGVANGVASLDANGLIPSSQLPSYVDDVLEYVNMAGFPTTGETSKIYVAQDTNKIYRWSGSAYIEIAVTAGSSDTANRLATARTIALSGDVTGSVSFDGSQNVTITATVADDSHNHVISNVDGLQTALDGKASTSIATTTANGLMSSADKTKLNGVAVNANNYSHPTGDGSLHVPATGTTNSGKVLTAGATAGSLTWEVIPSAPVTSVAGKTGAVTLAKADVGLGSVDNTVDSAKNVLSATKLTTARTIGLSGDVSGSVSFDGSQNVTITATVADDSHSHVISNVDGLQDSLDSKLSNAGGELSGDLLPATDGLNIGSSTQRWNAIYVDEAYLSTNTLYIGDTPVMGTEADTIIIKADSDQSIAVNTYGLGTTSVTSQREVIVSTSGVNADVKVQATGTNSKVRFSGDGGIELSDATTVQDNLNVSGNLTVSGNIVANGSQFIVNSTTVTTKDNIITVNSGEVGSGVTAGKAGIQVDRGDAADYQLVFDETTDKFVVGQVGGTFETLATREYVASASYTKAETDSKIVELAPTPTKADIDSLGIDAATVSGFTVAKSVPANAVFTDTVYVKPSAEPISYITGLQTALDGKAPLASPALTGAPTAPTAAVGTNTTQLATTAFVNAEIANNAPTKTGGGASGTWGIAISGNADTATTLATSRTIQLSGDVTGSVAFNGSANVTITAAIATNSVINSDLAQVATATLKGRASAGTGNVEDLTASQVRTILNVADGATNTPLSSTTPNALGTAAVGTSTTVARSDHVHAMPSANQLSTNAGDFSLNGFKATNLAAPVNPQDAATKAYVDAARAGLDVKDSVRVATTANITLSGTQTIDGISVVAGDRVLVKNQSTASTNGIYVVGAGAWTRSTDADTSAKVTSGMYCFIEQGTTQADTGWVLSTDGAITLGTTSLSFTQFTGVGALDAGAGLTKTGNQINVVGTANRITANADSIDIASTYAGQTSITTLGTIATGSWQASIIGLAYGGTGANLTSLADGTMLKKVGSALVAAVADTDYLTPNTVIDGGTF